MKVLVLGASVYHVSLFKKLKELEIPFVAVSYLDKDPGVRYADEFLNVSTTDIYRLESIINEQKITHVITTASDANTFSQALLNEKFEFPGVMLNQINAVSHKPNLVNLINHLGLPSPHTEVINLSKGIAEFWLNKTKEYILKPARGSGSVGVFKKIEDFPVEKDGELYLVQEYISGGDISGQAVVENGKIVFVAFSKKWAINEYVPFVHWVSNDLKESISGEVSDQLDSINSKVGFTRGTISFDLRLGEKPYIIDLSYRLSGNLLIEAFNLAYNINLYEHHVLQILDGSRVLKPVYIEKQVIAIILGTSNRNTSFENLKVQVENILSEYSDVNIHEIVWDEIDEIQPFINSRNRLGHVLISGENVLRLQDLATNIKTICELE
jgi:predicted ATP-grasp superfamily ATP-dependent carboligase